MDTIMIIRDSVATSVSKTTDICQHSMNFEETNENVLTIVCFICATTLIIALYGIYKYYKWKKDERHAAQLSAQEKRKEEINDREVKQQAELLNKLLAHLEKRLNEEETSKIDEKASKRYIKELKNLITAKTLPEDDKEA